MTMAALSPNSVLADPIQVNPLAKTDAQTSVPQVAQDALKSAKVTQTDTVTISAQALKMADNKNAVAKETAKREDEQRASQSANDKKNEVQRNAEKAYTVMASNR